MTSFRTELPIATEPWERAKSLFLEQLNPYERTLFEKADLDTIYHEASVSHRQHQQSSKLQAARRRLSPLVDAIDGYGKGLDVISNTPVAAAFLCPIWGGIRVALYAAQETEKYFEKLAEMLEKIGRTLPLFRDYQNLFPNHERLLQVLSEAYLNVLRFCTDVTSLFKQAKTRTVSVVSLTVSCRALWKPFTLRFAEYLKDFKDLKQQVQDEANVAHMIESKRERELQERSRALAETHFREEKLRQALQNLSPIDYYRAHRRLRLDCHQGTTQWIFDHDSYKAWSESTASSSIHCNGIPGSGKSILTSSVINKLITDPVDPSHLVCFYYCDYADHQTLDTAVILGTFIRQILEGSHPADDLREWVLNQWTNPTSKPLAHELLPAVLDAFGHFELVTIVIDALDELSSQDQHETGSIISAFLSLHTCQVKVFLSCRFEAIILNKVTKPSFSIALSPELLSNDIYHFVEDIVQDRVDKKDLNIRDAALQQEIIDKLKEGAHDMFLWVKFQIEELCEAMSDTELRWTLKNLPRDLAETYRRILYKVSVSTHGSEKLKLARRAFRWIVCAKRPLTIEELIEAVVVEEEDQTFPTHRILTDGGTRLRIACGSLVVFDEKPRLVRLAHHTVQQFLTAYDLSDQHRFADDDLVNSFRFTLYQAELQIYKLCLAYLCFSDFETQIILRDRTTLKISESGGFVQSLINYMFPESGTVGRITNLVSGRPYATSSLNTWNLSIQGNSPCVNREKELIQKYSLLGYVSSWWCFHTPSEQDGDWVKRLGKELAEKTRVVLLEKNFPFPHRPWDNNNNFGGGSDNANDHKLSMLRWVAQTGKFPLWDIVMERQGVNVVSDTWNFFCIVVDYDNAKGDILVDILHGGNEGMMELYFSVLRARSKAIPARIICRAIFETPRSRHAALFAKLKGSDVAISREESDDAIFREEAGLALTKPISTISIHIQWAFRNALSLNNRGGTILLEEAVRQNCVFIAQCILENDTGQIVYFGPVQMDIVRNLRVRLGRMHIRTCESPLARAVYGNKFAMAEVLFSYINGTSPFVQADIEDFDLEELYKELEKRERYLMRDHVQKLCRTGTGYPRIDTSDTARRSTLLPKELIPVGRSKNDKRPP